MAHRRRDDGAAKAGAGGAGGGAQDGAARGCGAALRSACGALFCLNAACCLRSACRQPGGCCARCCPLPQPQDAVPPDAAAQGERRRSQARSLARGKSMTSGSKVGRGKMPAASPRRSERRSKPAPAGPLSQELSKLDAALVEHNGVMRGAIPVLPLPLAWICLVCNVFVPGLGECGALPALPALRSSPRPPPAPSSLGFNADGCGPTLPAGTLSMGLFCLCVGKPRFSSSDTAKARVGAFCLDTLVAASQLFTVLFCLVGWGWSIWWGLIALRLASKAHSCFYFLASVDQADPPATPPLKMEVSTS